MTAALQIRSITLGMHALRNDLGSVCARAGGFLREARQAFADGGFRVQTTRLCTQPPHELVGPSEFPAFALQLEAACRDAGVDYVAAGGIRLDDDWTEPLVATAVVDAITATEAFFTSLCLDTTVGVDARAARAGAACIARIALATERGFGNLRFACAARCPANVPFFPVAYHEGTRSRFSVAVQWADLALQAVRADDSVEEACQRLALTLADWGSAVEKLALSLEQRSGVEYAGLDLTPAPFPSDDQSIGAAIEGLGVERLGAPGTLTAVATLTRALKEMPLLRAGFSGVMLPVLEDSVLAARVSDGLVSVSELLLYSAVCGTGLDTVPLPGDVTQDELAGLLADVGSLAVALDKPLTARLFPVPGKSAGDMTEFAFPFFANGRVMATKGIGSSRLLQRMAE